MKVRDAINQARRGLVDRELVAELVLLCAVAGEHLLVIGPPGTAKSEAVRRVSRQVGGRYFEYLLGRFTEPSEIFGPIDLRRLREGVVEVETNGMLPEADFAFLDEVFLGSTAVLNTLLGVLNERVYRRGSTVVDCPLRVCVGAANQLPEDPSLAAFADRFLVRLFVRSVADSRIEELLEAGELLPSMALPGGALESLDALAAARDSVDLTSIRPWISRGIRIMRSAGIDVSDRRAVRVQRLVRAAAVLDGRSIATAADLWVLPLIAPTADTHSLAKEALLELMSSAANSTMSHAAEEVSRGLAARAERLAQAGEQLLGEAEVAEPAPSGATDLRLRMEGTLREIDAVFDHAGLPTRLAAVRNRLVAAALP